MIEFDSRKNYQNFNIVHSKQKGNIASSAVIYRLNKDGYNVFHELGDLSKIDLIAEKNGILIRIQVKYTKLNKYGSINVSLRKSGPNNYYYKYKKSDFDYFAVYCVNNDNVYFVKSDLVLKNKNAFSLRINNPKRGKNFRFAKEYKNLMAPKL